MVMKIQKGRIFPWNSLCVYLGLLMIVVIIESGVCTSWREEIRIGLQELSLSRCKSNMRKLLLSIAPRFTHLQSLKLCQNQHQLDDQQRGNILLSCATAKKQKTNSTYKPTQVLSKTSHGQERSLQEAFYLALNTQASLPYTSTRAKSRGREQNGEVVVRGIRVKEQFRIQV